MNNSKEFIKFSHFKKFNQGCDFLIWHDFDELDKIHKEKGGMESIGDFSYSMFEDDDFENTSEIGIESTHQIKWKISDTNTNLIIYKIIEKNILNSLKEQHGDNIVFLKSKKIEDKIVETRKIIEQDQNVVIYMPVFVYENAICVPTFYSNKTKEIGIYKISSTTKMLDYLAFFWCSKVINLNNIRVNSLSCYVINNDLTSILEFEKERIFFKKLDKLNVNKSPSKNYDNVEFTIFEILSNPFNFRRHVIETNNKLSVPKMVLANSLCDWDQKFDDVLKIIDNSRALTYANFVNDFNLIKFTNAINPNRNALNKFLELKNSSFQNYSGLILRIDLIKKIVDEYLLKNHNLNEFDLDLEIKKSNLPTFLNKNPKIHSNTELELFKAKFSNYCVWYDFEGFAVPFTWIKDFSAYEQIVFQCSIIKTNNKKEIYLNNLIYDPQNFNYFDIFEEIINSIYDENADWYIVYNKQYEISRLKKMVTSLKFSKNIEILEKKFEEICDKTLDLMDLFAFRSTKRDPLILLSDLRGKYSIKLLEKYINKYLKNEKSIRHIKEYSTLEVQNGLEAMEKAVKRVLNVIKTREWEQDKINLQKYCENDVRAMIMVADFVEYLYCINK